MSTAAAHHRPGSEPTKLADFDVQREQLMLADACTAYEERLGWTVTADVHARRITIAVGGRVSALMMPEALANDVLHSLVTSARPAVVIAHCQAKWQTFLTGPRPLSAALPADLERARVHPQPTGTPIVLPVPGRITSGARWVVPPNRNAELPQWSDVVSMARRALREAQMRAATGSLNLVATPRECRCTSDASPNNLMT